MLCFAYETHVLEGKVDAKIFLGDIWNLSQADTLPKAQVTFVGK